MHELPPNILVALQNGSQLALEQLYVRYAELIFNRILVLVHDAAAAEELVNDIFLQLWQQRETMDTSVPVEAVLLRKARSAAIDYYRKSLRDGRLREQLMQHATAHYDPINDLLDYKEAQAAVEAAIAKLPPQRQAIFRRCKLEGKSYLAVAEELGITVGTVKDHMAKAMRSLKAELKGDILKIGLFVLLINQLSEKF
ncbi:sigma-70 family RNA polymerase sigma factor [Parapedobacter deserti]|uniref:Sigma-70 family RNA polymerase sigma factor n=1 Tax=Parapedobacter deserti TaxID=1912957 RepID=A0ABV7JSJ4_9SPHI